MLWAAVQEESLKGDGQNLQRITDAQRAPPAQNISRLRNRLQIENLIDFFGESRHFTSQLLHINSSLVEIPISAS